MGSKSQTQTSTSSTTPNNLAGLQSIFNSVQNASSQPFTPYSGELVAPVNGQQGAGISAINTASNYASPYIQSAAGMVQNASNPLTQGQIQQYQNPYIQNVVNATQAQFNDQNAQQQNALKGNAAVEGALGGDRQAVAQSTLAGQQQLAQAPTIANLYADSYNTGLQTAANQFQQNPMAAASSLGNLGLSGQNAALQGAQAQIGAGTLEQQTQQATDQASYQQYLQKLGYPFQTAQFFAQYGLPAAIAQGSNTNGTQTAPGPNTAAQIAGLGIAGAGLFLKDGGAVPMADGGSPFSFIDDGGYAKSYVPSSSVPISAQLAPSQSQFANLNQGTNNNNNPWQSSMTGLNGMKGSLSNAFSGPAYGGGNIFTDEYGGSSSNPAEGLDASDYGAGFKTGGFIEAIHAIHRSIKRASGGAVGNTPFASYADGGDTTFDDRFDAVNDVPTPSADVASPLPVYHDVDPAAMAAWWKDSNNPALVADANSPPPDPSAPPSGNPMQAALPPQITNPDNVPDTSPDASPDTSPALAFDSSNPLTIAPQANTAPPQGQFGHSLFGVNLSDKTRQALVAAGLGMMASRSPFFGTALGEGGLKGLSTYGDITKQEQEAANQASTRAQEQQRIDLQAKQMAQSAEQFAKNYGLNARRVDLAEDKTPSGYRQTKNGLEAIPGGPADPTVVRAQAEAKRVANAVLDDDTIGDMADQYLAGDRTVMQNLGRGAQGAENIVKLRQAIAQHAKAQGVDPAGIVNRFNEQAGALAGQRTVGARAANISLAANEANNMIPIALAASDKLPRSQFMPWNQMVQAVQKGTSSPELASFVAATNSLVNSYVRAVSPSGVPTDSMREHAYSMLNSAQGPEAYKAVIATMQQEMRAALQAPSQVKEELRRGNDPAAAASSAAAPANKPKTVIQNGHTYTLQPDGSYK